MEASSRSLAFVVYGIVQLGLGTSFARAQPVLVVGPGQPFTQLQAAIDAAPANAVIRVKPWSYGPARITKPLRIIGERAGSSAFQRVRIGDLTIAPSSRNDFVLLRHLDMTINNGGGGTHWNMMTNGTVHIDDCVFDAGDIPVTSVSDANVSFLRSRPGALQVAGASSNVLMVDSITQGVPTFVGFPYTTTPGVHVLDGNVVIAGGTHHGGGWNRPGLEISRGRVVITGDRTTGFYGYVTAFGVAAPAIVNVGGQLILDPDPAVAVVTGQVTSTRVPYLKAAVQGLAIETTLNTFTGSQAFLLLDLPGTAVQLPALPMPLWLTRSPIVVATGQVPPAAIRRDRVALPPLPFGTTGSLQTVVSRNGALHLSNPVVIALSW